MASKNKKIKFKIESEYILALENAVKELIDSRSGNVVVESDEGSIYCFFCGSREPVFSDDGGNHYYESYQENGHTYTRIAVKHYDNCEWEVLKKLVGK